ncbi:MAG: hypothetical protein LBG69_01605 [Zoogloeaceae bacterium]|nr:hypothetical protein [Zoogloeaceae bacterium]
MNTNNQHLDALLNSAAVKKPLPRKRIFPALILATVCLIFLAIMINAKRSENSVHELEISAPTDAQTKYQSPDEITNSLLLNQAIAFTERHFQTWSQDNATALPYLAKTYSSTVNFFGIRKPAAAVMKEKRKFAKRWPVRDYKFMPNTASSKCGSPTKCSVSGTVEWRAYSVERNSLSTGNTEVSVDLSFLNNNFSIVGENERIVSRKIQQMNDLRIDSEKTELPTDIVLPIPYGDL